jgi:hypothetical protein
MEPAPFGRIIIAFGLVLVVVGALMTFAGRVPRLPGDILIKRDGAVIYIPIVSSIVLSILLTVVLTVLARR